LYNDVIMTHIKEARNYHALADPDHTAEGSNPLCGDTVTVYMRTSGDRIAAVSFLCSCCGISMASASVMIETVQGRTFEAARSATREFLDLLARADEPDDLDEGRAAVLAAVRDAPSRVNCAALAWRTLEAALDGRALTTVGVGEP
jgi:nitrogen fixation NifU-like protein